MNKNEMLSATSLCCSFDNVELTTVDGINILGLSNINESTKDHYIVYRILNHVNGKHYVGQHHTCKPLDDYMGSGKLIVAAIEKYPISCFSKEILHDFNTFEEMNEKEAELVQLSNCWPNDPLSYNLIDGGHSPIMYGENNPAYGKNPFRNKSNEWYKAYLQKMHKLNVGKNNPRYGKSFFEKLDNDEYQAMINRMKENHKGAKNSQYGISPKERMDENTYKQWKANISKALKGKKSTKGYKWLVKGNIKKLVKPIEIQMYLDVGYSFKKK